MKRRALLMTGALSVLPLAARADSPPKVLSRYVEMLNTQDWSMVTEIVSKDYAPLYPVEDIPATRADLQQFWADDWIFDTDIFSSAQFDLVSSAEQDDLVFFLAEMSISAKAGGDAIVPYFGYLKVANDQIIALDNSLDRFDRSKLFGLLAT